VRYRNPIAEFEISDSGVGIPAEDLERVFQPFERGSAPNVRSIPGTGLGLTITKLLTHIMGGEIVARSTPGAGTSFTVRLLLTEASHAPARLHQAPIRGYEGAPRTVLLIDDDLAHLDIVQNLLRSLRFVVFTAAEARGGIELARQCKPDLALIDISMPDLSGWEVAKQLRGESTLERLKIVMVSANAHEYSQGGERELHEAFVMKPVSMQVLLDTIASVLQLKWKHDSVAPLLPEDTSSEPHAFSSQQLEDLYQLGKIGHVRGIQAKLDEIEHEHPANARFAGELRELIGKFEFKRFMSALRNVQSIEARQGSSAR
jgi:CheY-like chemotaxis protein